MKSLLLILFLFPSYALFSQSFRGTVLLNTHEPAEGAYVFNLRSGMHVHTNERGEFFLKEMNIGDSVSFSYVGYTPVILRFQDRDTQIILKSAPVLLEEFVISPSLRNVNRISNVDLQVNPVSSSQGLLRKVPGLFIGQHAGGGKAEQIFLRGFDCDHGTDINITVDEVPVNMVSHAHGQGYADLHFVIPETIKKIDFDKGPYYASRGNFATAGYVAFETKEKLENSSIGFEQGRFNTYRTTTNLNLLNNAQHAAYFASEFVTTDGFFDAPQNFTRFNVFAKYTNYLQANSKLSVSASHFSSKWDASGQIPERLVKEGNISRFGSVDNTEGGITSRTNATMQFYKQIDENTSANTNAFFSNYKFDLYSNFTFFLRDSINGDQIKQKESRNIFGIQSKMNKHFYLSNAIINFEAATGVRNDVINDIELSYTKQRQMLNAVKSGNVTETNFFSYVSVGITAGKWLFNPSLRFDHLMFAYIDKIAAGYTHQKNAETILSPKLNILYNKSRNLQYFLKIGKGFHSNDTRVVVDNGGKKLLPAAYGIDAGIVCKPATRIVVNAALWYLYLQQEFVYVGDEGVVEPSGRTARKGVDIGISYQPLKTVFINFDATYTKARAMYETKGADFIPLAPKLTYTGNISIKNASGFSGSLKARYLGDRPANETNTLVARGYVITDMNFNYSCKEITVGISAENIFNTEWNETQFATETRLRGEPQSVTEIHFTPGTPFFLKGTISFRF